MVDAVFEIGFERHFGHDNATDSWKTFHESEEYSIACGS